MDTPSGSSASPIASIDTSTVDHERWSRGRRWLFVILVIALLAVIAGGLAYHFSGKPLDCNPGKPVRHALPCDIPLVSDATFESTDSGTASDGSGNTSTVWVFTTHKSLDQLSRYYAAEFRSMGWSCVGGTVVIDLLAIAATNKADRPNSVAFMAFQINVPMSPNEFDVVLVHYTDGHSPLPTSFKCGTNLPTVG